MTTCKFSLRVDFLESSSASRLSFPAISPAVIRFDLGTALNQIFRAISLQQAVLVEPSLLMQATAIVLSVKICKLH